MKNKYNVKQINCIFLTLFMLVVLLISGQGFLSTFAAYTEYSDVLDDLQTDKEFNVADYPENNRNYSIQVIQVAESDKGELFVYTYQPAQKAYNFVATSINMCLSKEVTKVSNYNLQLLNYDGVFCKYRILKFKVSSDKERYYNIVSVYRAWCNGLDDKPGNGNDFSELAYGVGEYWKATTVNGQVEYEHHGTETIELKNPYVGMYRYDSSHNFLGYKEVDGHFISFDTDKRIDRLLEVDIEFTTQDWNKPSSVSATTLSNKVKHEETYTYSDTANTEKVGTFHDPLTWNRLQTVDEFLKGKEFNDEAAAYIKKGKWVINFYETYYTSGAGWGTWCLIGPWALFLQWQGSGTYVSEVSIMRLKFETDGIVYNLGVVSNKISGYNKNDNKIEDTSNILSWFEEKTGISKGWWITIIVAVALIILLPVLSAVFPVVGQILFAIFKGLWWLICLPFKGIKALIDKIRGE